MSTTWKIYWWAKTDRPKKYGSDIVTIEGDELTEWDADEMLSNSAGEMFSSKKKYELPNFESYYTVATHCIDFGVVKVKEVKNKKVSKHVVKGHWDRQYCRNCCAEKDGVITASNQFRCNDCGWYLYVRKDCRRNGGSPTY